MPEQNLKLTDSDKEAMLPVHKACLEVFQQIDEHDDRTIPPSRSDQWISTYRADLIAMIRLHMPPHAIVLDREILRVWLQIRKNPEQHGVEKR